MASKYNGGLFCSPFSTISPPTTAFTQAMSRSSSRDSTSSASRYHLNATPAYTSAPMSRPTSSSTYSVHMQPPTSSAMRRSSSTSSSEATWLASPYRSCLNTSFKEPSSYLSDDDLLCLNIPVESIPNPQRPQRREMTTEEQIDRLRQLQQEEEREQQSRRSSSTQSSKKTVRFEESSRKQRRPSQLKRRDTAVRRGLSTLNGPM